MKQNSLRKDMACATFQQVGLSNLIKFVTSWVSLEKISSTRNISSMLVTPVGKSASPLMSVARAR